MIKANEQRALSKGKNYIYTDIDATTSIRLALNLMYIGISVEGFISYEKQLEGIKLINLPVSSVSLFRDQLEDKKDTAKSSMESYRKKEGCLEDTSWINIVIPAYEYEKEKGVERRINKESIDANCIFTSGWGGRWCNCPFSPIAVYKMIADSQKRKLIIYATEHLAWELLELLNKIGVSIGYVVCDDQMTSRENIEIKNTYDIMDENYEEIKVLIADDKDAYRKLNEMGLKEGVEYADYIHMYNFKNIDMGYDPLLGYNFSIYNEAENLSGFVCYGDKNAENRIVILGGSAADATFDPYYSWPKQLWELMGREDTVVFCGGCIGYNSSQDILKLVRDALILRPNSIIHYTGYNDAIFPDDNEEYIRWPYYNYYLIDLARELAGYKKKSNWSLGISGGYYLGVYRGTERWDSTRKNVDIAKAVCEAKGIKYYCVLQPNLFSSESKVLSDKELFFHSTDMWRRSDLWKKYYDGFLEDQKKQNGISYVHDFTRFFSGGISDVWIDECHLNKDGNRVIAESMWAMIQEGV